MTACGLLIGRRTNVVYVEQYSRLVMPAELVEQRSGYLHVRPRSELSKSLPDCIVFRVNGELNDFNV